MAAPLQHRSARRALFWLAVFNAVSAVGGGAWLVFTNGGGMPAALHGPFPSFVVPGLLLGVVIGGTQLASALGLHFGGRLQYAATAVAGLGLLIWIFAEVCLILAFSPLHALYFGTGLAQVVLLLLVLDVLPETRAASSAPRARTSATQPRGAQSDGAQRDGAQRQGTRARPGAR